MKTLRRLFTIKYEIILVIAATLIQLFAPVLIAKAFDGWDAADQVILHTSHIIGSVVTGIFILAAGKFSQTIRQDTVLGDTDFKPIGIGLAGAFAWMFFVSGAAAIASCFTDNALFTSGNMDTGYANLDMMGKAISLFSMAIAAPLIEETIFRGMFMGALRKVFTLHTAVIVSALCFGLIHGTSIPTVAFATGMGLILGYTLVVSGSLQNCIVLHMIYNATSTFRAMQIQDTTTDIDYGTMTPAIIIAAVIMMFMAAIVLVLVGNWYYKKLRQN